MEKSNLIKLREIFCVILELPDSVDPEVVRQLNCPKWDSLATVSIMATIEGELGVQLDSADMERMRSFEATVALLEERGL